MADSVAARAVCSSNSDSLSAPSAPIPKSRRRWLQFSLFSLFALTTVVAVLLGLVIEPAWRQRDAKARLSELHVHIALYPDPDSTFPRLVSGWIGTLIGDETHDYAADVDGSAFMFMNQESIDAAFRQLARLPRIDSISITDNVISPENLRRISRLRGLRCLDINSSSLFDRDLSHLASATQLESLVIVGPITGSGLASLSKLQKLTHLSIFAPVTDDSIAHLAALKKLTHLFIQARLTDAALNHLSHLTSLESLTISESDVTDDGMVRLMPLSKLERFSCLHQYRESMRLNSLHISETLRLVDVQLDILTTQFGMDATIDRLAMHAAGIDPDAVRVTIEPGNKTAGRAILDALSPYDLVLKDVGDELVITTRAAHEQAQAGINRLRATLPNLRSVHVDW